MAAPLLAGLARIGAGLGRVAATGARGAARSGAKKLVKTKVKSFAKDKIKNKAKEKAKEKIKSKLSKKSELISSEGDQQQKKLKYGSMSEGLTPTLTGTKDPVKIKSAPSSKSQVEQLKINVTKIHSFLIRSNKQYKKQEANTRRNQTVQRSKAKLGGEERRLEKKSPLKGIASNIKSAVASTGSIFDKLFNFMGLILAGIIVNALPKIIETVKGIIDNIVDFLTPIQSGFRVIKAFFTGELDEKELDADKKRVDDALENVNGDGGLIDQIAEKAGPLGGLIKTLKPAIDLIRNKVGGKNKVLARKDGKEGVLNKDTGEFTERQFTSAERESYDGLKQNTSDTSGTGGVVKTNTGDGDGDGDDKGTGPKDSAHGAGGGNAKNNVGFVPGKGNKQKGIFLHWSAGSHTTPYSAYHSIALGDGTMVRNTPYDQDKYAHTAGANTNSVGLAIAAAYGAVDTGKLGQYAPTDAQLNAMTLEAAKLAVKWGWSEATIDKNVRTHGEWERYATQNGILPGKPQRWDLDRLKDGDPLIDTSKVLSYGGNQLREMIKQHFRKLKKNNVIPPTKAKIKPKSNSGEPERTAVLNQSVDDEGTTTIAIQQVNTIQTAYVPMLMPIKQKFSQSLSNSQPQLSGIWGV
tara:strand:+ start:2540 stop:4444 length:1905 start_codon:yes stop_codon:yes gene_type:complete